jgi:hypothetical protein
MIFLICINYKLGVPFNFKKINFGPKLHSLNIGILSLIEKRESGQILVIERVSVNTDSNENMIFLCRWVPFYKESLTLVFFFP